MRGSKAYRLLLFFCGATRMSFFCSLIVTPALLTLVMISCCAKPDSRPDSTNLSKPAIKVDRIVSDKTTAPSLRIENIAIGIFALRTVNSVRIATRANIERQNDDGRGISYQELDGAKGYRIVERCPADEMKSPSAARSRVTKSLSRCLGTRYTPCLGTESFVARNALLPVLRKRKATERVFIGSSFAIVKTIGFAMKARYS
jgi:hypothetical protein